MTNVQLYKSRVFVLTWHLIALCQYLYAIYYDWYYLIVPTNNVNIPKMIRPGLGGRTRFLTYWCLIIQATYFSICLINDFVGTNEVQPKIMPKIRKVKDYMLAAFAFPLAMSVGITFWALMAIDRELVFPKAFDAFFPSWLNHVMHTNIMVFIILEMCTSFRRYPSRSKGLTGLGIFMAAYLGWVHIIKHYSGIWVYPVLDVLQFPQRIVFFVAMLSFSVGLYLTGEFINNKIWTKEMRQGKTKKNK